MYLLELNKKSPLYLSCHS